MEEALGGGLAQEGSLLPLKEDEKPNLSQVIGKAVEVEEKDPFDLEAIIGSGPDVNLESGELKVVIKQKTKVGNDISFICDFEDFYEDELVVQAPRYSLPVGSDIVGKVALYYGGQKVVIEVEGKIAEIEDFGNKKETLIIALEGVDSSLYEKFMDLYQNRQENIEDFMQKAKGY
jgi:hypothetical protein